MKRIGLITAVVCVGFFYQQFDSIFHHVDEVMANEVKEGVNIGNLSVNISGQTLSGAHFDLEDLRGKQVVVNFFATWCHPCQEEMPLIAELEKKLTANDVTFVAVNLTNQERSLLEIPPFLRHYGVEFDPVLDSDGKIMNDYHIIGIPTTLVINEEGMITQRIDGMLTEQIIEDLIPFR